MICLSLCAQRWRVEAISSQTGRDAAAKWGETMKGGHDGTRWRGVGQRKGVGLGRAVGKGGARGGRKTEGRCREVKRADCWRGRRQCCEDERLQ